TDIVINTPNGDAAYGHVVLDGATETGKVTLAGGTGQLAKAAGDLAVAPLDKPNYSWDGPYSYLGGGYVGQDPADQLRAQRTAGRLRAGKPALWPTHRGPAWAALEGLDHQRGARRSRRDLPLRQRGGRAVLPGRADRRGDEERPQLE